MSTSGIKLTPIAGPWLEFLRAVDTTLDHPTEIHCIGGFALLLLLKEPRPTGDVDFIGVVPSQSGRDLERTGGSVRIAGRPGEMP